jgi:hypothetical protein
MDNWIHASALLGAIVVAVISFSIFVRWIFKLE